MDETVYLALNAWNEQGRVFARVLSFLQLEHFKLGPSMMVLWALWFWPKTDADRTRMREGLVATLVLSGIVIAVTRALANYLPYSSRPIHTDGVLFVGDESLRVDFDGWSSMPSDHASLILGFAVAIFLLHRGFGSFLIAWGVFVVCIPRIIIGLHWPSDIVMGWLTGAVIALCLFRPIRSLVQKSGAVPYFEAREALGHPILFLATFEMGTMFALTRYVMIAILT